MLTSNDEQLALQRVAELERPLAQVETFLGTLGAALHGSQAQAVDSAAAGLHAALASAVDQFTRAARSGGVPPVLRQRLALASGRVAAQREALARATASLDRAIDVLLPRQVPAGMYSSDGGNDRPTGQGNSLLA